MANSVAPAVALGPDEASQTLANPTRRIPRKIAQLLTQLTFPGSAQRRSPVRDAGVSMNGGRNSKGLVEATRTFRRNLALLCSVRSMGYGPVAEVPHRQQLKESPDI